MNVHDCPAGKFTERANVLARVAIVALATSCSGCTRNAPQPQPKTEQQTEDVVLTPAAAPAPAPESGERRCIKNFQAFDSDRDGFVTLAEFESYPHAHREPARFFGDCDQDADGQLTPDEFCCGYRPGSKPEEPSRATTPGRGLGSRDTGRGLRCQENFEDLDIDGDGQLTEQEFSAVTHPRGEASMLFRERDANDDGIITFDEFCPHAE